MLEHVCNPERNLVEGLVHDIIAVVLAEDHCRFVVLRQEVHKAVLQSHAYRNPRGYLLTPFPALFVDEITDRG